jgi:hypothetical protein
VQASAASVRPAEPERLRLARPEAPGVQDAVPAEPAASSDAVRLLEKQRAAARLAAWAAAQEARPVSESPAWTHLARELPAAWAVERMPAGRPDAAVAESRERRLPVVQLVARTARASAIHPWPGQPERSAVAEMPGAAEPAVRRRGRLPAAARPVAVVERRDVAVPLAPSRVRALLASGSRASAHSRSSPRPASALPA